MQFTVYPLHHNLFQSITIIISYAIFQENIVHHDKLISVKFSLAESLAFLLLFQTAHFVVNVSVCFLIFFFSFLVSVCFGLFLYLLSFHLLHFSPLFPLFFFHFFYAAAVPIDWQWKITEALLQQHSAVLVEALHYSMVPLVHSTHTHIEANMHARTRQTFCLSYTQTLTQMHNILRNTHMKGDVCVERQ